MIIIIVAVAVGAAGFFGGIKYQQSQRTRMFTTGRFNNQQIGGTQQNRTGFRPVNGEIIEQDDKSITVKAQDNSSKIIFLSDTTTISKSSEGKKTDLKVGETVGIIGIENSDGSITAQSIQLNPLFKNQN